ncbi:MAG: DUF2474 domain-containing protein [Rhodospirillaceae bacterium]
MLLWPRRRLWRGRILTFVGLWLAGVLTVGAVAWLIRWIMGL